MGLIYFKSFISTQNRTRGSCYRRYINILNLSYLLLLVGYKDLRFKWESEKAPNIFVFKRCHETVHVLLGLADTSNHLCSLLSGKLYISTEREILFNGLRTLHVYASSGSRGFWFKCCSKYIKMFMLHFTGKLCISTERVRI